LKPGMGVSSPGRKIVACMVRLSEARRKGTL
jgi:hypothetical protein